MNRTVEQNVHNCRVHNAGKNHTYFGTRELKGGKTCSFCSVDYGLMKIGTLLVLIVGGGGGGIS